MVAAEARAGEPARVLADPREAEWAVRGAAGDRDALRAIVVAHQDAVYRLLLRLGGDRELARDLAQDAFVKAFAALGGFRPGAPMRPWLFRIANNLFLDHVRRRHPESLDALHEGGAEAGAEDPALARLGEGMALAEALASLPVNWRQALVLRHDDDLSYEEIAEVLGVPIGTAKTWLFRGRERLRALLAPPDEEETR